MTEPTIDDNLARRKAFLAEWLPLADSILGVKRVETPLEERDLRDCPNALFADVSAALDAKLKRISERCIGDELRLSDAALAKLDRVARQPPAHPVGRDEPAPLDFDDVPLLAEATEAMGVS